MLRTHSNAFNRKSLSRLLKDKTLLHNAGIFRMPLANQTYPIHFILMCPEDEQICPITQEPMATSSLHFMDDGESLDPEHPDRTAIQLPCQHRFNALCLVYQWMIAKNVKCPLCRSGPLDAHLRVSGIPRRLRIAMKRNIFMTNPVSPEWFAAHEMLCTIEAEDRPGKHTVRLTPTEANGINFNFSLDVSHIVSPKIVLQMIIRSPGRVDTLVQSTCPISVQDPFELRIIYRQNHSAYYIAKMRGAVRVGFYASTDYFRQMAWDHDHGNPAHRWLLNPTSDSPCIIQDL